MRKLNGLLILVAFCGALSSSAQTYTSSESSSLRDDSLFVKSEKEPLSLSKFNYSIEVHANQASNVITAGFARDLAEGGFISRNILDPVLNSHTMGVGYLGGSAGVNVNWSTLPEEGKQWSLCGSFGSEVLVDTRWTQDLFELIWYGNASQTGEVAVLSGSGARMGVFNRFSIGGLQNETKQRFELSFIQRLAGVEWSLPYGYMWVSENADSLETYLQTEARLHANADTTFLPAYGLGISGNIPIHSDDFPLDIDISFRDVGLLLEPAGSKVYWFQEGISTTGLPVFGDSLTWESIYDGDISTDSLLMDGESSERLVLLPSRLSAQFKLDATKKMDCIFRVDAGGWMPQTLITAGLAWDRNENFSWGVNYRDGGWGEKRIAVWTKVRLSGNRSLYVNFENPIGLMLPLYSSVNTMSRGITFRFAKENG